MSEAHWTPSPDRIIRANMTEFLRYVEERGGPPVADYSPSSYWQLYEWSLANPERFWSLTWRFCGIIGHRGTGGGAERVGVGLPNMAPPDPDDRPHWFPDADLNFAENLLRFNDDEPALVSWNEEGLQKTVTYRELKEAVATMCRALKTAGVVPGDRVAALLPNIPEAVVAMLAATTLGAIRSSCSPDFGAQGVMDRFGQIEPKILFAANGYLYNGKEIDLMPRLRQIAFRIPTLEHVIVTPYRKRTIDLDGVRHGTQWDAFIESQSRAAEAAAAGAAMRRTPTSISGAAIKRHEPEQPAEFQRFPFAHPLYIMYSSGTTGLPKCMVHSAGGTLLQ